MEKACNSEDNHKKIVILKDKDGICISRTAEEEYNIKFKITQLLHMPSFIDFNIFQLIIDLNKDIFESSSIDINNNNNEANITVNFQPILNDLGIQGSNRCLLVKKIQSEYLGEIDKTIFHITSIVNENEENVNELHYESVIECTFLTNNSVSIIITKNIRNELVLPFIEMLGVNISGKIISRVKQFIEEMINI